MGLDELIALWGNERKELCDLFEKVSEKNVGNVMFSHQSKWL
jgi:hypothetical protein